MRATAERERFRPLNLFSFTFQHRAEGSGSYVQPAEVGMEGGMGKADCEGKGEDEINQCCQEVRFGNSFAIGEV